MSESPSQPENLPGADTVPVGDRPLLEQLVEDGGVLTETPRPRLSEYVVDVVNGVLLRISEWLFGAGSLDDTALRVVQWMIAVIVVLLAAMLFWRWLRWWRGRARVRIERPLDVVALEPAAVDVDWRAELEVRLEGGDAAGALEALWWWLAVRLEQVEAEASWTTRELVHRAGRRDLLPLVRRWDRLVYGGGEPDIDGVRGLWSGLREKLA